MFAEMFGTAVDGSEIRPSPVDMVDIPLFTGFEKYPRWLFGISSINSATTKLMFLLIVLLSLCLSSTP